MTSVDDAGNVGPAHKATGFMTNNECFAEVVDRRCFGGHHHIQLLNCTAKACEKYPHDWCGDTARVATEHACRGMRPGARGDVTRPSADDRSTGCIHNTSSHAHFPEYCQCRAPLTFTRTCVWLKI